MRFATSAALGLVLIAGCTTTPAPTASQSPSATPVPTVAADPTIAVDQSLLDVLPESVDGVPIDFAADASAEVAADQEAAEVDAVAYAVAAAPATDDLLVVALGRLREGVFDEEFFRSWRDAYNREVCGQAGGVRGNAESEIAGRHVFIGSCADGGNTYHVWLDGRRTVVSAVSFGDRRLGERLMGDLRP